MCRPAFVLAIFGLQALSSCGPRSAPLPLDEDKLVKVLIDVHVAEAALQSLRGQTKDSISNIYYGQIFQIHDMSQADFEAAMLILRDDPWRMEALYAKIMAEMERQDAETEGEK